MRLLIEGGNSPHFSKTAANRGTRVGVRDIFFNLPARKKFLKSSRGEASLCRNVFIEKAIAHPAIGFKFFSDQKAKLLLPALEEDNYSARIAEIYPDQCPGELLHPILASGEGFSLKIIIGLPPLQRSDRKYIHLYCNRRRISEFSLVHAVEYAFSAILPGGKYPVAFVFLDIDPADIDFNIHPAKKEVRFKKPELLHRRIRESIQEFISFYARHSSGKEKVKKLQDPGIRTVFHFSIRPVGKGAVKIPPSSIRIDLKARRGHPFPGKQLFLKTGLVLTSLPTDISDRYSQCFYWLK